MSRCFPFPPPGYEKKARTEDPDLLKKEKQREKKHKEKKDKEKRESKEKKDKDRSDEKHKEKKDKKEKHSEKKKEKDRDKDKSSNTDEKRLSRKSESHDGEKTSYEKKFPGKSEGHNGEKFSQKKEKDKDRSSYFGDKKVAGKLPGYSGEKHGQNSYLAADSKDSKFLQVLGKRVGLGDDDRATGNQLVEKFVGTERKRDEETVRLVAKATESLDEGQEKKDKRGDDRKLDEQGVRDELRFCGNVMVQNLAGMVQTRVEGTPKSLEKDAEIRTEGKENTKQKEGNDKHGDKCKHNDREKNDLGKDKEKKKEKEKMKIEHLNTEKVKLKDIKRDDNIGIHKMKTSHPQKDSDKTAVSEGNLRKRKDFETNGFFLANDIKPNKLSRPMSSTHPLMDTTKVPTSTSSLHPVAETNSVPRPTSSHSVMGNGRILEPCQTSALFTSGRQGAAGNLKADSKECKVNGVIISQPLSVSLAKPLITTTQTNQIAGASMKPPHPDTKYLSQVLAIPKVEEWSDIGDQEWLFQSRDSQLKKPMLGSSMNDEMPPVWAEAIRIESADVCALPYVIPY